MDSQQPTVTLNIMDESVEEPMEVRRYPIILEKIMITFFL
jgi:hypothetical protein